MRTERLALAELGPSPGRSPLLVVNPVDGQRLAALFEEHLDFVWRTLRRLGVPVAGVDDAAQQVWMILSRKLGEIVPGNERAFLFGVALRIASDERRKLARQREVLDGEPAEIADPKPDAEEMVGHAEDRALLDEILDALPMELRVVFVLYELEEQTALQIADLLALPAGTVASRLRRARSEFEKIVKRLKARGRIAGGPR